MQRGTVPAAPQATASGVRRAVASSVARATAIGVPRATAPGVQWAAASSVTRPVLTGASATTTDALQTQALVLPRAPSALVTVAQKGSLADAPQTRRNVPRTTITNAPGVASPDVPRERPPSAQETQPPAVQQAQSPDAPQVSITNMPRAQTTNAPGVASPDVPRERPPSAQETQPPAVQQTQPPDEPQVPITAMQQIHPPGMPPAPITITPRALTTSVPQTAASGEPQATTANEPVPDAPQKTAPGEPQATTANEPVPDAPRSTAPGEPQATTANEPVPDAPQSIAPGEPQATTANEPIPDSSQATAVPAPGAAASGVPRTNVPRNGITVEPRAHFVGEVYLLVIAQLLVEFALVAPSVYSQKMKGMFETIWLTMILAFVSSCCFFVIFVSLKPEWRYSANNYYIAVIHVILHAWFMIYVISSRSLQNIHDTFWKTCVLFLILTIFSSQTRIDFTVHKYTIQLAVAIVITVASLFHLIMVTEAVLAYKYLCKMIVCGSLSVAFVLLSQMVWGNNDRKMDRREYIFSSIVISMYFTAVFMIGLKLNAELTSSN